MACYWSCGPVSCDVATRPAWSRPPPSGGARRVAASALGPSRAAPWPGGDYRRSERTIYPPPRTLEGLMAKQAQRMIQRPEWGARFEDGFGPRPVGNLKVYVHHSVTVAPNLLPPFTDDYAAVRELERIGEQRFGHGISYQVPITPAGLVFEGVSMDRVGAAISNYNTPSANIVWIGNYDRDRPPLPMLHA